MQLAAFNEIPAVVSCIVLRLFVDASYAASWCIKVTYPVLSFAKKVGRTAGGVGVVFSICDRRRRPVSLVITSRYGETLE